MRRNRIAERLALFSDKDFKERQNYEDARIVHEHDEPKLQKYSFQTRDGSSYNLALEYDRDCNYYLTFELEEYFVLGDDGEFVWEQPDDPHELQNADMNAVEVMMNVVSIVHKILNSPLSKNINTISFTSNQYEPSRTSLYRRLIQRWGFEWEEYPHYTGDTKFVVYNPNFSGECPDDETE
jgi:hypothetical protein